jgi:hypothetical protein
VFLDSGNDYQQRRLGEQFGKDRSMFYRGLFELGGDKAAGLFNLIEVATVSYFQKQRDAQDGEVVTGLQALRRTLSPLHIPGVQGQAFAEHLKKEYDAYQKQAPGQLPDTEISTEVLDRILKFVNEFSGNTIQSNRFLNGLIGYVRAYHPEIAEHLATQQDHGRIVLPGQLPPPLPASPAESHQHCTNPLHRH